MRSEVTSTYGRDEQIVEIRWHLMGVFGDRG